MVITINRLVGSFEPFEETIRHLISRNWDNTKTNNITPVFMSPLGQDNNQAANQKSAYAMELLKNKNSIIFDGMQDIKSTDGISSLGLLGYVSVITIEIRAQTTLLRDLFKIEVNRILHEKNPNSGTPIKKSDNINNSPIANFDNPTVNWLNVGKFSDQSGFTFMSAGELRIRWHTFKT